MDTMTRREFAKTTAAGAIALGIGVGIPSGKPYDAKGLPTRIHGKTNVALPIIGLGAGSRFCGVKSEDEAQKILETALDHGLYYWDTAHDYAFDNVVSEERLGRVLRHRRKEVFLATKVGTRDVEEAKRHLEESLNRLQTDFLDLYQLHAVRDLADVDAIGKKDGMYEWLRRLKEQKVVRFIGYTGHLSAAAMKAMAERYEFDSMLIALNHYQKGQRFEEEAVPAAARRGLGVSVMKVIRPREKVKDIPPEKLILYALSLPHVTAAVIGMDSVDVVRRNVEILRSFKPLGPKEMEEIRVGLRSFFEEKDLPWMTGTYRDGNPT
ncbi:MAG: aldo/keto reductase [candidate division KSB1 bacterium]|nr:aldo/keto reductase [candidate division KSB1 bacterium]